MSRVFHSLMLFIVIALVTPVVPSFAASKHVYQDEAAGFSIKKPKDWVFMTGQELVAHALKEAGNDQAVPSSPEGLVVVVARHPEPHPDLNATAQVVVQPLGQATGIPPALLMKAIVEAMQGEDPSLELVEAVHDTKVSGLPAAAMTIRYTVHAADGGEYTILSRMWVVPRGREVFIIDMNGHADGPEVSEREFKKMLKSIRIDS